MNETQTAWLAGLFEGEGCLHRRKDNGGYELVIAMTDRDVVDRLPDLTGYGTVRFIRRPEPHWSDKWRWRVGKRDHIAELLTAMLPYLGCRRGMAAAEFLAWFNAGAPCQRTDVQRAASAASMRASRAARRAARTVSGPTARSRVD